jgi:ALG6, ALG8 glycosyltransferase family
LNFKHIYLYAGLAFFAYILKNYVLKPDGNLEKLQNLIKVGVVTLIPFFLAFLPFIAEGGI